MNSPITKYRRDTNRSLEALASEIGVDKSTLWRWEAGRVPVERLADVERVTSISRRDLRPDIFGDAQ
jgi:DNA-binding transcriptional regulator YdaS (Cro superfamily)